MADAYGGAQLLVNTPWASGGGGINWNSQAEEELRRQRELLFGTLAEGRAIWNNDDPINQQIRTNLNQGMMGNLVPYTPEVQARLFSRQADSQAAAEGSEMARIRRHFADSGMGGGGGELAMMLAAGQRRAQATNAAQADIAMQSLLENFMAQQNARDAAMQYQASRAAAESPYRLAEAQARGRFEITGQGPGGTNIGIGGNPYGNMPSNGTSNPSGGSGGGSSGSSGGLFSTSSGSGGGGSSSGQASTSAPAGSVVARGAGRTPAPALTKQSLMHAALRR